MLCRRQKARQLPLRAELAPHWQRCRVVLVGTRSRSWLGSLGKCCLRTVPPPARGLVPEPGVLPAMLS